MLSVLPRQRATELKDETDLQVSYWSNVDKNEIKHGPIHADLFRNNVLFRPDGKLAAVIDWGFCASDSPLIYDLAIVANDWCLKDEQQLLDEKKLIILLDARAQVCPFSQAEKQSWGMALRLAALRFYLSRQHDVSFPRDEAGKTLDPEHFYRILIAHKLNANVQIKCAKPSWQIPVWKGPALEHL